MTGLFRCRLTVLVAVLLVAGFGTASCSTATSGTAAVGTAVADSSADTVATTPPSPVPSGTATTATSTVTQTVTATSTPAATPTTPPPAVPPTDLSGEVYGFVTAVDVAKSQITLDKVDWFTGAAAQQACAQDGVTQTDNNWCTGYYYRNVNPALRVVAVSPTATISTLQGSQSVPSDLSTVADRVGVTGGSSTYHLIVTDGAVTDLSEMYRP